MSEILSNDPVPDPLSPGVLPDDATESERIIHEDICKVIATMNMTMATIDAISMEVQPMIESLAKNPLFKMMGGGR